MERIGLRLPIVNKSVCRIVNAVMALFAALVTPYILKEYSEAFSLSNSVYSFLIFGGYFALLQLAAKYFEKRSCIFSVILGFVFSVFMVFGRNVYTTNAINITELKTWVYALALTPIFSALVLLCFRYLSDAASRSVPAKRDLATKKRFFIVWALIFAAWIPSLLASYPGVYGYDSVYQINYYLSGEFSLHHPIAHTYLLGFCVITLGNLLGSYEAGMCCYSVFQMLCLSASFSIMYSLYIVKRAPKWVSTTLLLLFMFLPTNAIMAFSATKDVLFAAFFALATMLFLMLAETPSLLKSVKFDIALVGVLFLMTAFRNQGIYIILATFVFAFIAFWKYKKNLLPILLSFILLFGIYNGPVTTALGGKKANSLQEMMSVPCVQLSRAALYGSSELTSNELRLIEEYIGNYEAYSYNSGISDVMKRSLDTERLKSNPMEFIKLWVQVGLKCPAAYIDAFARLTIGYWYPDMNYRDMEAYHPYWEYYPSGALISFDETKYVLLEQTPVKGFEALNNWIYDLTYNNTYQSIPIVSMLFSSGLPLWCVLIYTAFCLYKKQYGFLIPAGFVFLLILTLLLGPVVLYRYVYPVCTVTPLLLVCAMNIKEKGVNEKSG